MCTMEFAFPCLLVRLPGGRTRVLPAHADVLAELEEREGLPREHVRLVGDGMVRDVRLHLAGGGGDQPDWTERGMIPTGGKKRGPDARAPDWHADPQKYAAKMERDKRERGELVVAVGPFCVPCGKRFAKQSVYDAHLSGKKHLNSLQRMGRDEEAMVCQLDMEAKRRRLAAAEEAKHLAWRADAMVGGAAAEQSAESAEAAAARRAIREEALRKRAMLPMPDTVAATSVYDDGSSTGGSTSSASTSSSSSSASASASSSAANRASNAPTTTAAATLASEAATDDEEDAQDDASEPVAPDTALPPVAPDAAPAAAPWMGAFEASAAWQGARVGMAFKCGPLGVGYYEDVGAAARAPIESEAATP
jgi:hypothetical protein